MKRMMDDIFIYINNQRFYTDTFKNIYNEFAVYEPDQKWWICYFDKYFWQEQKVYINIYKTSSLKGENFILNFVLDASENANTISFLMEEELLP